MVKKRRNQKKEKKQITREKIKVEEYENIKKALRRLRRMI